MQQTEQFAEPVPLLVSKAASGDSHAGHVRGAAIPAARVEAKDGEAGFTLLEILVVIVILGLLIGLVAPAALRQLGGARVSVARQSIERLGAVLDLYKLDVGTYPGTDQGLQALTARPSGAPAWNGPYVKADAGLVDAWNHPYVYRNPSSRAGHDYDLCSLGPNAQGGNVQASTPTGGQTGADAICNP